MEIDIARPLKRGFWLENGEDKIFIVVLFERLHTLCLLVAWWDMERTVVTAGQIALVKTRPWRNLLM